MRGLAVIAVAMSVAPGTTVESLCHMLPSEVMKLEMPRAAWKWVLQWLHARRAFLGSGSDHQPWLTFYGSRGMPKQVGWAACQTLHRAQLPGWRLGALLRAPRLEARLTVPFHRVARRFLGADSALRGLAMGR